MRGYTGVRFLGVVIAVALLGVLPASGVGAQDEPPFETTTPSGGDGPADGSVDGPEDACGELTMPEAGWSETELWQILDCADIPGVTKPPPDLTEIFPDLDPAPPAVEGAPGCDEISVETKMQRLVYVPYLLTLVHPVWTFWTFFTCTDGSPTQALDTWFQQIRGTFNLGGYCGVRSGSNIVIREATSSTPCRAHRLSISGPSAVVIQGIRLRSSRDRNDRQVLVWADADGDRSHDRGEAYEITHSPETGETSSFSVADISRVPFAEPGAQTVRRLRLRDSRGSPLETPLGIRHAIGPSEKARPRCRAALPVVPVMVLTEKCRTSSDGFVEIAYGVGAVSGNLTRGEEDRFIVYRDSNGNGRFDTTDRYRFLDVRVAKAVNYVALGDSYSAGEDGNPTDETSGGQYFADPGTADLACRRARHAYSQQLVGELPGAGLSVESFACTGAITFNLYDNRDSTSYDTVATNRPSSSAQAYKPGLPDDQQHSNWEPRQVKSLSDLSYDVDLVTITVGGNDLGFTEVLQSCFADQCTFPAPGISLTEAALFAQIRARLSVVLNRAKLAAPFASIVLLGYPNIVPPASSGDSCDSLKLSSATTEGVDLLIQWLNVGSSVFDGVSRLIVRGLGSRSAPANQSTDRFQIDRSERRYLRSLTQQIIKLLSDTAEAIGVHFIDVTRHFEGHDPCAEPAYLYGLERETESPGFLGAALGFPSDKSFHPNSLGHGAYAAALSDFIADSYRDSIMADGVELNEAGLPKNPRPGGVAGRAGAAGESVPADAALESTPNDTVNGSDSDNDGNGDTPVYDRLYPLVIEGTSTGASGCGWWKPGGQLGLLGGGYQPDSSFEFIVAEFTPDGEEVGSPYIDDSGTADADGLIRMSWTFPEFPSDSESKASRHFAYLVKGTGIDGKPRAGLLPSPLTTYPDVGPCANDDSASTSLDKSVRVAVLSNDVAPTGGSLDPASVHVAPHLQSGGDFVTDPSDGSLTFTPDPGFVGEATARYVVYDNWGAGVNAVLRVNVAAGCTVTEVTFGSAGHPYIVGTEGDDVICVPDRSDPRSFHLIYGHGGDDVILGGRGVEWISAGAGNDIVYAGGGDDDIWGDGGIDEIHPGAGRDDIYVEDFLDRIVDADGRDDIILISPMQAREPSKPVVSADTVYVRPSETVLVDVLGNDYDAEGDLEASSLRIVRLPAKGSARYETSAETGPYLEFRAAGEDPATTFAYEVCDRYRHCSTGEVTVLAAEAECTIVGTEEAEVLTGTPGDDVICGFDGDDTLLGEGGNDVLVGGSGNDRMRGGAGDDVLHGGPGDDDLLGDEGVDVLYGGLGADELRGGAGADHVWGGAGGDEVFGNSGSDRAYGGHGVDGVDGGNDDDVVRGGPGDDALSGGSGDDEVWGDAGDDMMRGRDGADMLFGDVGDDRLHGGPGDDRLDGWVGDDILRGEQNDDILLGGLGEDNLNGNTGSDYLDGGFGFDTCTRGKIIARCEAPRPW